nr:hypothetical protein [Pontibacter flavimaris]
MPPVAALYHLIVVPLAPGVALRVEVPEPQRAEGLAVTLVAAAGTGFTVTVTATLEPLSQPVVAL